MKRTHIKLKFIFTQCIIKQSLNTKNKILESLGNAPTLITRKILNLSKETMMMTNHIYKQTKIGDEIRTVCIYLISALKFYMQFLLLNIYCSQIVLLEADII